MVSKKRVMLVVFLSSAVRCQSHFRSSAFARLISHLAVRSNPSRLRIAKPIFDAFRRRQNLTSNRKRQNHFRLASSAELGNLSHDEPTRIEKHYPWALCQGDSQVYPKGQIRMPILPYFLVMGAVLTGLLIWVGNETEPNGSPLFGSRPLIGPGKPFKPEPEPRYRITAVNFAAPYPRPATEQANLSRTELVKTLDAPRIKSAVHEDSNPTTPNSTG